MYTYVPQHNIDISVRIGPYNLSFVENTNFRKSVYIIICRLPEICELNDLLIIMFSSNVFSWLSNTSARIGRYFVRNPFLQKMYPYMLTAIAFSLLTPADSLLYN